MVVDNASGDETPRLLERVAASDPRVRFILNRENRGFSAANNQGISRTDGEYVVLLNNDVLVTAGWLEGLLAILQDETVGMVGPVTNRCGNEARIRVNYKDEPSMRNFARVYTRAHRHEQFDIGMLAMYCVALRRAVLNEVGLLDEKFGIGMFEDDDYALRVHQAGYRTVCTESVFIHHEGQASFKALIRDDSYMALWKQNQAYFEAKWGRPWRKPSLRPDVQESL
jgi:GT2 family glycosyltransferase